MRIRFFLFERSSLAVCAMIAMCVGSSAGAQNAQCATAYKAMMKLWDTPWHMSMVDSAATDAKLHGGKPRVGEEIYIGGVVYVQVSGKWRKSPVDIAEMRKDGAEKMAGDKSTCTHVRDESVNGEVASVWSIHSVTEYGTSESLAWVSKSRGIVLKSDTRMDVGGSMGKSHTVASYDYANVHAPAGAQ